MAVREFDGVDDTIDMAVGALSGITHGTVAALAKRLSLGAGHTLIGFRSSAGASDGRLVSGWSQFNDTLFITTGFSAASAAQSANVWYLIVARKATGTQTARVSVYNYSTTTWTHANFSAAIGDATAPGAGGTVRFRGQFDPLPHARLAVRAAWSNTLPWAANATGDAAIVSASLHTALQKWVDAAPGALWAFNQAAATTAVTDLMGGGADQTAIVGTSVVTTDDPPGFDFNLTPAARATSSITLASTSRAGKVAATGGVSALGGSSTGQPGKVAPASGTSGVALTALAAARKTAGVAGVSPVVVGSVFSRRQLSAQGGVGELGLTTTATPRKIAIARGVCSLTGGGTGLQRKIAPSAGVSALTLAPSGGQRKLATSRGLTVLALTGDASGRKTGRQGGASGLVLVTAQARPVVYAWPPRAGSVTVHRVATAGEVTVR